MATNNYNPDVLNCLANLSNDEVFTPPELANRILDLLPQELFRKVTGLTLKDFSLLVSLGVFNSELMNDAVYKFKRYEDSSLEYTGIDRHSRTVVGLWDTAVDTSKVGPAEDRAVNNPVLSPDNDWSTEPDGGHSKLGYARSSYAKDSSGCDKCLPRKPWESLHPGDAVTHKSLGTGTVIFIDDNYLTVRFSDRESKSHYPSAFEKGYLSV